MTKWVLVQKCKAGSIFEKSVKVIHINQAKQEKSHIHITQYRKNHSTKFSICYRLNYFCPLKIYLWNSKPLVLRL